LIWKRQLSVLGKVLASNELKHFRPNKPQQITTSHNENPAGRHPLECEKVIKAFLDGGHLIN
jgi:hypothetical protein